QRLTPDEARDNPRAAKTWRHNMNIISYLPHTLSPLLMVMQDRVAEVTAMGTRPRSYYQENVEQSDIEVALMKTAQDSVIRAMVGFSSPVAKRGENIHHCYVIRGTHGALESQRSGWDKQKMWLHDHQMADWAAMPWGLAVIDAPAEATASGHGGMDYYPISTWLDAIRGNAAPAMDVYTAVETAAPAAAAIESIQRGSSLVKVPDFRPSESRPAGQEPATRSFNM
ncbi:MAG TPA: Gfo/Idh/MocA family oxidoreductase, partial [Abditibacteriaceae bacterium]|nr:Gfo/Idh/MocA family oxidoreductase [Abditibacteriaceae bacterium]